MKATYRFRSRAIFPVACVLALGVVTSAQTASSQQPRPGLTLQDVLGHVVETEAATLNNLMAFRPVVEVYVQRVVPDAAQNYVPSQDAYLLGRFNWLDGPRLWDLNGGRKAPQISNKGAKG